MHYAYPMFPHVIISAFSIPFIPVGCVLPLITFSWFFFFFFILFPPLSRPSASKASSFSLIIRSSAFCSLLRQDPHDTHRHCPHFLAFLSLNFGLYNPIRYLFLSCVLCCMCAFSIGAISSLYSPGGVFTFLISLYSGKRILQLLFFILAFSTTIAITHHPLYESTQRCRINFYIIIKLHFYLSYLVGS